MNRVRTHAEHSMVRRTMETFGDGVFAIAATLLLLNVHVNSPVRSARARHVNVGRSGLDARLKILVK